MKERPILFSGPMVRALLDGSKTQTRRVVKAQPTDPEHVRIVGPQGAVHYTRPLGDPLIREALDTPGYRVLNCAQWLAEQACPYGAPGDRLWVREAWAETRPAGIPWPATMTVYREGDNRTDYGGPWKPSIHMKRSASRITLEVVSVRVERLQAISEADARAEGAPPSHPSIDKVSREFGYEDFSRSWYAQLWDEINGAGAWAANPWVWVVEFRRLP